MTTTTQHTIRLYLEDGGWMTQDNSPEVFELFGTDTLPTPFLEGTPVEDVLAVLTKLNPEAVIVAFRFKIGQRVRVIGSLSTTSRRSRIEGYYLKGNNTPNYWLKDGGLLGQDELEAD